MKGQKLRLGIAGMGNAGMMHLKSILGGGIPEAEISAVCDNPSRLEVLRKEVPENIKLCESYEKMLKDGLCDAVIITTPHFSHPEMAMQAFKAGCHVFCEKPAGVFTGNVREMNKLAAESGKIFSMHFNRRLEPVFLRLKELIDSGETGETRRISWVCTDWFRTEAYFSSGGWRGTWKGEGGGLLLNQCIHNLDIWQNIFGLPDKVTSSCYFGKYHNIEVEDEVTAVFEYGKGVSGVFIASTGESPGTNRMEIVCDYGKITVEDRTIKFLKTSESVRNFSKDSLTGFGEPENILLDIEVKGTADLSGGILRNFINAVVHGEPLLVPGEEGIKSLELANAILLSSWLGRTISLPVDERIYLEELDKRINSSSLDKKVTHRVFDLKDSFK